MKHYKELACIAEYILEEINENGMNDNMLGASMAIMRYCKLKKWHKYIMPSRTIDYTIEKDMAECLENFIHFCKDTKQKKQVIQFVRAKNI